MALPNGLSLDDRESVVRYLLLRALLNQQGDTGKVRALVRELYAFFRRHCFLSPCKLSSDLKMC